MQTITVEPLRGQEAASRVTIQKNDSQTAAYYQVTRPSRINDLCCGRPVEELPRILPMLAPAHHLAAAMALDRLFGVEPPEPARRIRGALLQAQYCSSHLRKLFFVLTARNDPFADWHATARGSHRMPQEQRMISALMHHQAVAQEAEDILGGRHDHPLTAVAGGVSRFPKPEHIERLDQIAATLLAFAREAADFFHEMLADPKQTSAAWLDESIPALTAVCLGDDGQVTAMDPENSHTRRFPAQDLPQTIGLHTEPWTYQPFAYFTDPGWPGLTPSEGLFFVGPLARLNAGYNAGTPLADDERRRLSETLGPPPCFSLAAAVNALLVELIQASESLGMLTANGQEQLTGPAMRTIPQAMAAQTTWTALEAPQGTLWHHLEVDQRGVVKSVQVVDAAAANNALKNLLAGKVAGAAPANNPGPDLIKAKLASALLFF